MAFEKIGKNLTLIPIKEEIHSFMFSDSHLTNIFEPFLPKYYTLSVET